MSATKEVAKANSTLAILTQQMERLTEMVGGIIESQTVITQEYQDLLRALETAGVVRHRRTSEPELSLRGHEVDAPPLVVEEVSANPWGRLPEITKQEDGPEIQIPSSTKRRRRPRGKLT